MKKTLFILVAFMMSAAFTLNAQQEKGWPQNSYFKIGQKNGRAIFIDPKGRPFYSRAMVYAYGP